MSEEEQSELGFKDKHKGEDIHISEKACGSYEQRLPELGVESEGHRVEEVLEQKIDEEDGVITDHISYNIMQASQWTFSAGGNRRYMRNYENIDWSE